MKMGVAHSHAPRPKMPRRRCGLGYSALPGVQTAAIQPSTHVLCRLRLPRLSILAGVEPAQFIWRAGLQPVPELTTTTGLRVVVNPLFGTLTVSTIP